MARKILAAGFAVTGLMLTFAGLGLVALTQQFLLYIGLFLLILAVLLFLRG